MSSYFIITLDIADSNNTLVYRFLPMMHGQNVTSQLLAKIQNREMVELETRSKQAFYNNFIAYADAEGVVAFEETYQITPDTVNESLGFRKDRILNRKTMLPPFTKIFLTQKMETIFGSGNWELNIDYGNYYIGIDIITNSELYEEFMAELRKIVPANMVLETALLTPYTYRYLNKNFTYADLEEFTYEELSQYS
jgi:hypothetical protein